MVFVLVISRSSECYDTLFSIDLKAEKRTITVSLVAVDDGALAPAGITIAACLVVADNGVLALVATTCVKVDVANYGGGGPCVFFAFT
jgi:hypothetical protein